MSSSEQTQQQQQPAAAGTQPPPQQATSAEATAITSMWPTEATSYDLIGKIGQGAFATVWRATKKNNIATTSNNTTTDTNAGAASTAGGNDDYNTTANNNNNECAVKVLNLDNVDCNLAEIRSEVQAMRLSSHANVLPCYTAFCHETNLWLVTQFMNRGSSLHCLQTARRIIRKQKQQPINMEQYIMYILHQTLEGLQYIHENGQIHRDIKAGNILLDGQGDVKIADFGVSGWLTKGGRASHTKAKTFVGTPCWMAPEVMEQVNGYDTKADIWSLGITALELAKGYAPYAKYPPMKVLILTIQEDPPSLDTYNDEDVDSDDNDIYPEETYSKQFVNFVDTCLQKSPSRRPTTQGLLKSKYMSDLQSSAQCEKRRQDMVNQVCSIVPDVGSSSSDQNNNSNQQRIQKQMPGLSPVSILLSTEKDRPAGTTWVFADGSSSSGVVVSSSQTNNKEETVDDVMAELDAFGMETGGEHYQGRSNSSSSKQEEGVGQQQQQEEKQKQQSEQQKEEAGAADDLNAFMDEFELNTAGEDFRR